MSADHDDLHGGAPHFALDVETNPLALFEEGGPGLAMIPDGMSIALTTATSIVLSVLAADRVGCEILINLIANGMSPVVEYRSIGLTFRVESDIDFIVCKKIYLIDLEGPFHHIKRWIPAHEHALVKLREAIAARSIH